MCILKAFLSLILRRISADRSISNFQPASVKRILCLFSVIGFMFFQSIGFSETLCAEVRIEISQEVTLERQAFDANMKIGNALETLPLENVTITVNFKDNLGNDVAATSDPNATGADFIIRLDTKEGIDTVDGGTIAPDTTADIHWLIIPAPGASQGSTEQKPTLREFEVQRVTSGTIRTDSAV